MIILIAVAGLVALMLIIPLFMRKIHHVKREIIINTQSQKAFDYLKLIGNQDKYNKWAKSDGDKKEEFKGTDGTVGYIYSWSGNKDAGEGEKEITNLVDGKKIELEYRFVKPFKAVAHFVTTTEAISDTQTKVAWSNTSALRYPLNIFVPMIEKSLAKDMDESLNTLKAILEK